MNPRERVTRTLNHQEPDRVPMMMSASPWVVERLKGNLNVSTDKALLRKLNIDIFDTRGIDLKGAVGPKFVGPQNLGIKPDWCGDLLPVFGYHEVITETPFGKAYSMGPPPLADCETIEDLQALAWPELDWFDFSELRADLQPWAEEFAIAYTGPSVFQHATLFRGLSNLLIDMASDQAFANYLLDKITSFYLEYTIRFFEETGDLISIIRLADDIGAENGLLISPKMIEQYLGGRIKLFADLAHEHGTKLMFHTDGNVRKVIPNLIDWGVDILDPVQPEIDDMNHIELKREFGEKLCFSGGVSAQMILPQGDSADVRSEVKRVIDQLGHHGGYILSPGHPVLQSDVPTENIIAMYEAGLIYGKY